MACGQTSSTPRPAGDQQLELTAAMTVDGLPVSQTWHLPAVAQTHSSGPSDFAVAMNPLYAPLTVFDKRTVSGSIQPADSAGVFLVRLPSGEGIGIPAAGLHLWNQSELTTTDLTVYLFDSADRPARMVEVHHVSGGSCPAAVRIAQCKVQLTLRRIPAGTPTALSTRTLVFASLAATGFRLPGLASRADLASIIPRNGGPAMVTLEPEMWTRMRNQAASQAQQHYPTYKGGTAWAIPPQIPTKEENETRRLTRYVTTLTAQDADAVGKIAGQLEYKGQTFTYKAWREVDQKPSPAIVGPAADTIIVIRPVITRRIELVSLR